jgi:hypothetical protein
MSRARSRASSRRLWICSSGTFGPAISRPSREVLTVEIVARRLGGVDPQIGAQELDVAQRAPVDREAAIR